MENNTNIILNVDEEKLVKQFMDLVKIPSPSLQERNVANYVKVFCEEHQIPYREDDAGQLHNGNCGNVIARTKGNGKTTILFSAHMDTVVPCEAIHPVIKEGVIYSDQTSILGSDDKSGIAAMLTLMEHAVRFPQRYPDMVFVFSIAEEIGLLGARALANEELAGVEAGFILDASGRPGECVIGAPFMANGSITIRGKEAHAGNAPEQGINALVVAASAISRLKMGRIDEETTCNIGTVHGGLANNIVMPLISFGIEARSRNEKKLNHLIQTIEEEFEKTCAAFGAGLEFDLRIDTVGYQLAENSSLVQLVRSAANQAGLPSLCKFVGGASDTNIYQAKGVTAMTLATGMTKVHTVNESIRIVDLISTARWINAIAQMFA